MTQIGTADSNQQDGGFAHTVNQATSIETQPNIENGANWKYHCFYKLFNLILGEFVGPKKKKQPIKDNRFKFIAEQLISSLPDKADTVAIRTTHELLYQHRIIEDTEARRRLEKWACITIIVYLVCVLLLVVLNGVSRIIWPNIFTTEGFISDTVMYVILSTTTINIIGLGIIVLKGHFPQNDTKKEEYKSIYMADVQNHSDNLHQS